MRCKIIIKTVFTKYNKFDLIKNPKRFWNYASIKKQQASKIPYEIHWGAKCAKGDIEISDMVRKYC